MLRKCVQSCGNRTGAVQVWPDQVEQLASRGFDYTEEEIAAEMHSDTERASECSSDDDVLWVEALTEQHELLHDTVEDLHSEAIEAMPAAGDGHREAADNPRSERSAWFQVRHKLVHDGEDPATTMTVLQAAFNHVEAVHRGSTLAQVEMDIKRALAWYGPGCGKPAADNPKCRYPPSYYLCKIVCDVGDLAESEVHLCPEVNCPYMTEFPAMSRADLRKHVDSCSDPACRRCHCPCGGRRMTQPGPGCTPQPQAPCYFFRDVFQQFFLDKEWYDQAAKAHTERRGNFYRNLEGLRILQKFEDAGVSADAVCRPVLVL